MEIMKILRLARLGSNFTGSYKKECKYTLNTFNSGWIM